MRIVLHNPKKIQYPPLGLGYLASYATRHGGFDDLVIDETPAAAAAAAIAARRPDLVGITSCSATWPTVRALARELAGRLPGVPVILGGPHLNAKPDELTGEFAAGVYGEGEQTFLELVQALAADGKLRPERLATIAGLAWRARDRLLINPPRPLIAELDTIPPPARARFDPGYFAPRRDLELDPRRELRGSTMITARGCPCRCSFCQKAVTGETIRFHSPEYVASELAELINGFGLQGINLIDELFTINRDRLRRVAELLEQRELAGKARFTVDGRANLMDDEMMVLLKRLNVRVVSLGLETMAPRVLARLKENVTVEDNRRAVDLVHRHGLAVSGQFILGTPGETAAEMDATLDYLRREGDKFSHLHLCVATPLPKTPLWDEAVRAGRIDEQQVPWEKLNPEATPELAGNVYLGSLPVDEFKEKLAAFREIQGVIHGRLTRPPAPAATAAAVPAPAGVATPPAERKRLTVRDRMRSCWQQVIGSRTR